ncbi:MAG: hypothetical protein HKO59_10040, partial [Phycisphaerales bacterium]|nr:hypothetical protein [Phycisphaerae bacterium]NNM26304.1 hypothetical protein [Phycisphaerales bacterium]
PWVLSHDDWTEADDAEFAGGRTLEHAGRVASLVALAAAAFALARSLGVAGLLWGAPLLALIAGWWIPPVEGDARRWARGALSYGVVPILTACVALRVDLITHFTLAPVVLLVILSGDGRWLGAFAGATLPGGRGAVPGLRLVIGSMACAPTQLAVTLVGAHTGLLPEPVTLALLLGAIMLAVTTPARRRVGQWLRDGIDEPPATPP